MTKKSIYLGLVFSFLMSSLIFILGFDRKNYTDYPIELYQVYLNGDVVGVVDNKEELYDLIDKEQESLKSEYSVNKIYPPTGLEIMPVVTYDKKTQSAKSIYEKIKNVESFTLKGYEVTITDAEGNKKSLYILNESDLETAIDNTITAFVNKETLELYRNNTQPEIIDVGTKIESVKIAEEITVKKAYISTKEEILTNANDLSRYLLFGTLETQETYSVTAGDTISEVADTHGLNIDEFLIANPEIKSANALLFPGQQVNIGLIEPLISVVVDRTKTEKQINPYETTVKYDPKITVGTSYIEQKGVNGENKVTFRIESVNGADTSAIRTSAEEITPAIEEIIIKGGLSINYAGDSTYWAWPTIKPLVITSLRGWRDGSWHAGIDIAGTGHGSPLYAIQSGVIIGKGYEESQGYYLYIDHQNGYWSIFMHMSHFADGLEKGDAVVKGQMLGGMGNTGYSTGTHLHFEVHTSWPRVKRITDIDPMQLYPASYQVYYQ